MNQPLKCFLSVLFVIGSMSLQAQKWTTHSTDKISIEYPSNWTLDESGEMGTVFFIFAPLLNDDDPFSENVNLITQDVSAYGMTFDDYMNVNIEQLEVMMPGMELIESNRVSNGKEEIHTLEYKHNLEGKSLHFIQKFRLVKGIAYVLTFTAEQQQMPFYRETANKIIASLKLK